MNSEQRSVITSQTILVVDDEPQACEIIIGCSESVMGHRVESAHDGMEAIEMIKKREFSIVVTDMDMPRMDGMQLIEYIVAELCRYRYNSHYGAYNEIHLHGGG